MIKDIEQPKVENVAVAVVQEENKEGGLEWNVYLVNMQDKMIEGVLVSSRGYGENKSTGGKIETSTLRHFLKDVEPKSFSKIEPIMENVFGLNNEYWVSFFQNSKMYDKKYIFLPETIKESNFINIPVLDKPGILIG